MYKLKYLKYKSKYINLKINQKDNNNDQDYWIGPYDVLVPNHILSVRASDGYNLLYKTGGQTEIGCLNCPKMTQDIYRKKYAIKKDNGKYYLKNKE